MRIYIDGKYQTMDSKICSTLGAFQLSAAHVTPGVPFKCCQGQTIEILPGDPNEPHS